MDERPRMPDILIALIQNWATIVAGALITWLASNFGLDLSALAGQYRDLMFMAISTIVMTVWYLLWRAASKWVPALAWLIGWPAFPARYVTAKSYSTRRKVSKTIF